MLAVTLKSTNVHMHDESTAQFFTYQFNTFIYQINLYVNYGVLIVNHNMQNTSVTFIKTMTLKD